LTNSGGFDRTKKVISGLLDVVVYHIAVYISFWIRYEGSIPFYNYSAYESSGIYIMIAFILLNVLFGIYILYNKSRIDIIYLTVLVQLTMSIAIMALTYFGRWFTFPRSVIGISFIVSTILLLIWRFIVFGIYEKVDGTKNVMVVGSKDTCKKAIYNFGNAKNKRHQITLAVTDNFLKNIKSHLDEVDIVYLSEDLPKKAEIYDYIIRKDKKIFLQTSFENLVMVSPNIMNIEDESLIEISNFRISPENDLIKRLIDFLVSLILIVITAPIMIITALLVKATSKGPVLYKQIRITKNQKEFNILKFRTMGVTAEKDSGPVLATSNDVRVTPIGKYLRSLRIDELPQLFNVLKGDMSLVGPRPERPFFVDQFNTANPYYYLRHNVRAGITGYAQVYGKYATDFNSKLNFDLLYIKKYSLILDAKIMVQTIKVLFDKVSSQGVEEEFDVSSLPMPETIKVLK